MRYFICDHFAYYVAMGITTGLSQCTNVCFKWHRQYSKHYEVKLIKAISLIFTIIVLAGCGKPIFTDQQERELENRLARAGISAQYAGPMVLTKSHEPGLQFKVNQTITSRKKYLLASETKAFLSSEGIDGYSFVGILVPNGSVEVIKF